MFEPNELFTWNLNPLHVRAPECLMSDEEADECFELIEDPVVYPLLGSVLLFQMGHNPENLEWQIDADEALPTRLAQTLYPMRQWWREWRLSERERSVFETPAAARPSVRETPKIGRNDPCLCLCLCGSGKKYKKCCGA